MGVQLWTNNARTSLAAGISPSDTALSVAAGQGARFPNPTAGNWFLATIDNGSENEIIKVTARSTDSFATVARGQEGTTARAWSAGTRIEIRITKETLEDLQSSDVATDAIWQDQGDIAIATGAGAAEILPVGADGQILTADSGETTGVKWAAPSSGGIATGTYASLPAAGNAGAVYIPTDSFYTLLRDNGASWDHYINGRLVTPPDNSLFSDFNMSGASVITTNGGAVLTLPAAASTQFRGRTKTKTAPYTITAAFLPLVYPASFARIGLFFTDGTKTAVFGVAYHTSVTGNIALVSSKFTNSTTISADYSLSAHQTFGTLVWLRIADDSTNRICSFSSDGINFIPFHTVTRTDFLTPTSVGFGGDVENSVVSAQTFVHWKET
jgi:hypothetical protein